MSAEGDRVRLLAERIARSVAEGGGSDQAAPSSPSAEGQGGVGDELAAVRASLEELRKRLVQIESHVAPVATEASRADAGQQDSMSETSRRTAVSPAGARSPWLSGVYVPAAHPSQEKFGVEEAAVSELVDFFEGEKKCELEPGGKPCDHCAMCSTRGF